MRKVSTFRLNELVSVVFLGLFSLISIGSSAEVVYSLSLRGEEFEVGNLLEWSTIRELNTEHFIVQKSVDGTNFTEIGEIKAEGLNDEAAYQFLDIGATEEKAFYRLKEMTHSGAYSFSHVILVRKLLPNKFTVVNMNTSEVAEDFQLTVDAYEKGTIFFTIGSMTGDLLFTNTLQVEEGLNNLSFTMESLPEGTWKVVLEMGAERESLVIRKVKKQVKSNTNNNIACSKEDWK